MKRYLLFILFVISAESLSGQIARQRVVADRPIENTFFSQKATILQTVETISQQEMLFSIMHVFGPVGGGVNEFWGLDTYANIRLGLDYGIRDNFSVGIGRSKLDKTVDMRFKYNWLRQMESGKNPVSVAFIGNTAVDTRKTPGNRSVGDRMSFMGSVLLARKMNETVSVQLSPTITHFNVVRAEQENTAISVGWITRYRYAPNRALAFEAAPIIMGASANTYPHMALSYEMETGGHVFQLFFAVGDGLNEQYAIGRTQNPLFRENEPSFRFGFNVNRIFRVGERY
jgi:hypothetical protein